MIPGIVAAQMTRKRSDPYFDDVISLLHFDGADASTTFTDEKGIVWTPGGDAQIDTDQSRFGGSSLYLDGTGDYLTSATDSGFAVGTDDFTVECWCRIQNSFSNRVIFALPGGQALYKASDGRIYFWNGSSNLMDGGATIPNLSWVHVALVRSSGTLALYTSGTQRATASYGTSITANQLRLGAGFAGESPYFGWQDDFRFTAGVARYTGSFSVPTLPFPDE